MRFSKRLTARNDAFTLIELLCTLAIIAILVALSLPVIGRSQTRAKRAACANNLKSIGVAFHAWAHDHNDLFPMQVSTNQGGTREFADATAANPDVSVTFRHFQAISNELAVAKVLRCPADKSRTEASDFISLSNSNVSYWINPAAGFGRSGLPVAGDRNVRTSGRIEWTFIQFSSSDAVEFSAELHGSRGNVLFGDGHVSIFDSVTLRRAFASVSNTPDVTLSIPREDVAQSPGSRDGGANSEGKNTAEATGGNSSTNNNSAATNENGAAPNVPVEQKPPNPLGSRRRDTSTNGEGNPILVTLLNGTVVTSSVPRTVTNTTADIQVPTKEGTSENPLVEFARWLVRTTAKNTYALLFLLLAALIAFEVARRRAQRKRGIHGE